MGPVAEIEHPEPADTGAPRELLMNRRAADAIHLRIVAIAFAAWIFDFYPGISPLSYSGKIIRNYRPD